MNDDFLKQCKGEGIRDRQGAEEDCGRIFSEIHDILGDNLSSDLRGELEDLRKKCPFCVDTFIKTLDKTVDISGKLAHRSLNDKDRTTLRQKVREGLRKIRDEIDNC